MTPAPIRFEEHLLGDDGLVPNNARIPVRLYRRCLPVAGFDPERAIIAHFARNGWGGAWINGIYPFRHYHGDAHEVLGIARGSARVQLGGPQGPIIEVAAGDAIMIPAGVGHCLIRGRGLSVVGAYPPGQERPGLSRATPERRLAALPVIASLPVPPSDPVAGGLMSGGPEGVREP